MMDGLHPPLHAPEIGRPGQGQNLLLTTILADAINLGPDQDGRVLPPARPTPSSPGCKPGTPATKPIRRRWPRLVNAQFRHPFAEHWGDGTTSSSDGQNFRTGSKAESTGHINPKYGSSPRRTFYTHISDQYAPFHTKVVKRRRARLDLCARRPAVPRIRPAHRGTLHRHGGLHRSRLRVDAPAGLPLRAAHPRPGRHQALHPEGETATTR